MAVTMSTHKRRVTAGEIAGGGKRPPFVLKPARKTQTFECETKVQPSSFLSPHASTQHDCEAKQRERKKIRREILTLPCTRHCFSIHSSNLLFIFNTHSNMASNFSVEQGSLRYNTIVFIHTSEEMKYVKAKDGPNGKIYLRCLLRGKCPGTARIVDNNLMTGLEHNHSKDEYPQDAELKNLLKRKASEQVGNQSKRQVFDSVTREHARGSQVKYFLA